MSGLPGWLRPFEGLSCYTANLAGYLAGEWPDAGQRFADSVRLAVRTDLAGGDLAFSHHAYPLDRMPDGSRLRYAGTGRAGEVPDRLGHELDRHGRVLVMVDSARLPWSPAHGTTRSAPHWLLVADRRDRQWQVFDAFAGLSPAGEQRPHAGWLTTGQLVTLMTPAGRWSAAQRSRNALAFGYPVPVPATVSWRWLHRVPDDGCPVALAGTWLVDDGDVLQFLATHLTAAPDRAASHLDDIWSAAQHRVFRYRWRAGRPGVSPAEREHLAAAGDAWGRLPGALRFAVDSAARGRPRTSLIHTTLSHLLDIEVTHREPPAAPRKDKRS